MVLRPRRFQESLNRIEERGRDRWNKVAYGAASYWGSRIQRNTGSGSGGPLKTLITLQIHRTNKGHSNTPLPRQARWRIFLLKILHVPFKKYQCILKLVNPGNPSRIWKILEIPRKSMKHIGNSRKSMKIHENHRNPWKFKKSMNSKQMPWNPWKL